MISSHLKRIHDEYNAKIVSLQKRRHQLEKEENERIASIRKIQLEREETNVATQQIQTQHKIHSPNSEDSSSEEVDDEEDHELPNTKVVIRKTDGGQCSSKAKQHTTNGIKHHIQPSNDDDSEEITPEPPVIMQKTEKIDEGQSSSKMKQHASSGIKRHTQTSDDDDDDQDFIPPKILKVLNTLKESYVAVMQRLDSIEEKINKAPIPETIAKTDKKKPHFRPLNAIGSQC